MGIDKRSELIGKTDMDFVGKEIAELIKKTDDNVITTGKKIILEEPYIFKGIPSTMLSEKVPLRDEKNNIIGVLGVSFDISEEKKIKSELLIAKAHADNTLRALLNNVSGHVYIKDTSGKYLYCNEEQAESFGRSVEEVIGKTDYDLAPKDKADKYRSIENQIIQTQESVLVEEPAFFNEQEKVFLSKKAPFRNDNGEVIGIIGVSIDITDRKEKERFEIEREADKKILEAKEKFKIKAQQVAHDINSPLGGLMMIIARLDPKKTDF